MAAGAEAYDSVAALAEFHASRATVRDLVESGIASVPPLFIAPGSSTTYYQPSGILAAVPTVDLSLPHSASVPIVGAAARTCGFFHVTNHGVDAGAAVSAVRAFHEMPAAVRSAFYTIPFVEGMSYTTVPYVPGESSPPAGAGRPVLPWRVSLRILLQAADLGRLPAACRDALVEYQRCITELAKKTAILLSEALGIGAERLETAMPVEGWLMACTYYQGRSYV